MRKLLLTSFLAAFSIILFAQEVNPEREKGTINKKGEKILPQRGDFSLGLDATSFFNFIGNSFNNTENNTLYFSGQDYGLSGKYFMKDNQAIRLKLSFNTGNKQYKALVRDDADYYANNGYTERQVTDTRKNNFINLGLTGGYEFRRGYGRLQAFFGPQLGIGIESNKFFYDYGNQMTVDNPYPTSEFYYSSYSPSYNFQRNISSNNGVRFSFFAGGFVGVEYFIARKISLGAELGLNFIYSNMTEGKRKYEYIDTNEQIHVIKQEKTRYPSDTANYVGFQTKAYGAISFNFYF